MAPVLGLINHWMSKRKYCNKIIINNHVHIDTRVLFDLSLSIVNLFFADL